MHRLIRLNRDQVAVDENGTYRFTLPDLVLNAAESITVEFSLDDLPIPAPRINVSVVPRWTTDADWWRLHGNPASWSFSPLPVHDSVTVTLDPAVLAEPEDW